MYMREAKKWTKKNQNGINYRTQKCSLATNLIKCGITAFVVRMNTLGYVHCVTITWVKPKRTSSSYRVPYIVHQKRLQLHRFLCALLSGKRHVQRQDIFPSTEQRVFIQILSRAFGFRRRTVEGPNLFVYRKPLSESNANGSFFQKKGGFILPGSC